VHFKSPETNVSALEADTSESWGFPVPTREPLVGRGINVIRRWSHVTFATRLLFLSMRHRAKTSSQG